MGNKISWKFEWFYLSHIVIGLNKKEVKLIYDVMDKCKYEGFPRYREFKWMTKEVLHKKKDGQKLDKIEVSDTFMLSCPPKYEYTFFYVK